MLKPPSLDDLRALVKPRVAPWITLQLGSPASRGFTDLEAVRARYRNARDEARLLLEARGTPPAPFLAGLERLEPALAELPAGEWTFLAFVGAREARSFALSVRLPDRLLLGEEPALLTALASAGRDSSYRVLVLSSKHVALLEGSRAGLGEVDAPEVPKDLEAALGDQIEKREDLQHHGFQGGSGSTVFHGQGGAADERSHDLRRFHQAVARAVEKRWSGRGDPLVLAADPTHHGRFRALASLPGLLEEGLHGGTDRLSPRELHARAWPLVERELERRIAERFEALGHSRARGKVVEGLSLAAELAREGRVARLWVGERATHPTAADASALDELDLVAAEVLRFGGEIEVLDASRALGAGPFAELRA